VPSDWKSPEIPYWPHRQTFPLLLTTDTQFLNMELTKKFYSQRAIAIATYFGGPLAAGYLVKRNYETLEQPENGKKALIIGIVSTVLLLVGVFSIPEPIIDKIPNALIPLIYTGLIYWIVEKLHGEILKSHKESGGEFYSGWKAAGIGAIAMVILIAGIVLSLYVTEDLSGTQLNFDSETYDKEVAKFVENENKAVSVFNVVENQSLVYLINEFNKGLVLWKDNLAIVERLNGIENLPEELADQNIKLLKYCELRIKHNEVILKAITEDTDIYVSEIEQIGAEINQVLKDLEKTQQ